MKLKVIRNERNQETVMDYYKVRDKVAFRFELIKKMMEDRDMDRTIYLDTNQRLSKEGYHGLKEYLEKNKLIFKEMPTKARETKMFGIIIDKWLNRNKKKPLEHVLVFEMNEEAWQEDFFREHLMNFDLAIGFGRKCEFYNLCDQLLVQGQTVLFNDEFFEAFVYDSIICTSIRATFDLEKYIK